MTGMQPFPEGLLDAVLGKRNNRVRRAVIKPDATAEDYVDLCFKISEGLDLSISRDEIARRYADFIAHHSH